MSSISRLLQGPRFQIGLIRIQRKALRIKTLFCAMPRPVFLGLQLHRGTQPTGHDLPASGQDPRDHVGEITPVDRHHGPLVDLGGAGASGVPP